MAGKSALVIDTLSRGPITYVRLYGTIDETFDPSALIEAATGSDIIFNLKAVTRISSFGVRDWVHTIEALRKKVNRIVLVDCSPAVVAQLNMVANFSAGASVVSVQAPYYCEKCSWDTEVSVPLAEGAAGAELPKVACKRCRSEMVLDDDPETFFAFRKSLRNPTLDPSVKAFIEEFSRPIDDTRPDSGAGNAADDRAERRGAPSSGEGLARRAWEAVSHVTIRAVSMIQEWVRGHRRVAIGIGLGILAVGVFAIVLVAVRTPGIPPKRMALFHESVASGHFAKAEELVGQLQRERLLTKELNAFLAKEIADARLKATNDRRNAVAEAYRARRHEDVVLAANRVVENVLLDLDSSFLLADSLRQLDRCQEALPLYATFEREIVKTAPTDKRLDDVAFWQGECALRLGLVDAARGHFRRVVYDLPRGDFRTSALARLKSLPKK